MISFAETVLNTKPNKPEENIIPYTYEETVMCIYEYGECYRNLNKELSLFSEADTEENLGKLQIAINWLKALWEKFVDWLRRVFGFANANHGNVTPETLDALYEELNKNIVSKDISDISIPDVSHDDIDTSDVDLSKRSGGYLLSSSLRKGLKKLLDDNIKFTGSLGLYVSSDYDIKSVYRLYVITVNSAHKMYKYVLENDKIPEKDIILAIKKSCLFDDKDDKFNVHFMCGVKVGMINISSAIKDLIKLGATTSHKEVNMGVINSMMKDLDQMIPSYTHKYENGRLVVTRTDLSCEGVVDIGHIGSTVSQTIQKNDTRIIHSFKINSNMDIGVLSKTIKNIPTNVNIALLTDIVNHLTVVMEQYHIDATAAIYVYMMRECSWAIRSMGDLSYNRDIGDKL